MDYFNKVMKESMPVVMLCTFIAMFSGVALSASEDLLALFPVLLLMLPVLNDLIGDTCQVLVSRFTTHLYLGIIPPRFKLHPRVKEDFIALLVHTALSLVVMYVLGFLAAWLTGTPVTHAFQVIIVLMITTFVIFLVMFLFLFSAATWLFKHGKDPSNFLVPLTTSVIDFLSPVLTVLLMLLVA